MVKLLFVFGTRPEAIKMAPVVKSFASDFKRFETAVCVTAQHRQMLDQVLDFFEITPDYDLNLMKPNQNLYSLTGDVINGMKRVLEDFNPKYVFVHGDTTTTMASSIASFYGGVKVCHVEAGLRTYNKQSPFPEEINRQVTGRISDFHFAPTIKSESNLRSEGIKEGICITGNTVIDALLESVNRVRKSRPDEIAKAKINIDKRIVLVTGHRRENFGSGFLKICQALKAIATLRPEVEMIYPVHLNPNVRKPVYELLKGIDNIKLIDPLDYPSFVWLMDHSYFIITDSGGVQEEAPSLGKPVLVMRDTTERPEAVEAGTVKLVGTDNKLIVKEALELIDNEKAYNGMSKAHNPYGDGKASQRIYEYIKELEYGK
ncbi:MAG: UDP-N-acetylglucosamine 2-epimerase (non-hydrolyzing) [Cyclobacteriaceae bacterium]